MRGSNCDIVKCHKRGFHVLEDMSDGEFITVCGMHFRQMILKGGYRQP